MFSNSFFLMDTVSSYDDTEESMECVKQSNKP